LLPAAEQPWLMAPPPDDLLARCCAFLTRRLGLRFPPERWPDLERALAAAAPELGCSDLRDCQLRLLSAPLSHGQLEILASHLTIGETYFFREPAAFAVLRQCILPALIKQRRTASRRLRLWSAGCASGEEAYSIAIELTRLLPDLAEWNVSILATDINPRFLAKAARGIYEDWSFRDGETDLKESHFSRGADGRHAILPHLKALVSFDHLNLVDDSYPAIDTGTNAMDIIFCRNVMMYFQPERAAAVIEKLSRCLVEGGWLVVSPVEVPMVKRPELQAFRLPGTILFQKQRLATPLVATVPLPLALPTASPAPPAVPTVPTAPHLPPDAAAMAGLARAAANNGQLEEALAWCRQALDHDKLNPAWSYLHATILLELGDTVAAAGALRRTLYLDHHCVMAHLTLGHLMARQEKPAAARRHFRNVQELLAAMPPEQLLTEGEGISAGRLGEIVAALLAEGVPA